MNKNFNEKKEFKKIKENITEVEYKKLMSFIRGNETLRFNTKQNLLRTFTILFFTGLRLNEVQELKIINIKNLIENKNVKNKGGGQVVGQPPFLKLWRSRMELHSGRFERYARLEDERQEDSYETGCFTADDGYL